MLKNYVRTIQPNYSTPFKASDIAKIYQFPTPPTTPITISVISFGGGLFGTLSPSGILTGGDVQACWTSLGISISNQPKVIIILLFKTC